MSSITRIHPSTFSIVAFSPEEKAWGIAVASKFLAVGAVVPWARAGAGAVATQAYANTSFGPKGLDLLEAGLSAEAALQRLLDNDPQKEQRQVGLVDLHGGSATFTGDACFPWAGGLAGENFAAQGNILRGENVVPTMAAEFQRSRDSFSQRLFQALLAGDQAGGDRRGRQSAAILVVKAQGGYGGFNDRWIDYRVDDHPDPITRLGELLELHELYFGKSNEADTLLLRGQVLEKIQRLMARLGYSPGPANGEWNESTRAGLRAFIGNENFEERTDFEQGRIDRPVLEYLLRHFGETE